MIFVAAWRQQDRAAPAGHERAGLAENGITDRLGCRPKASVVATATKWTRRNVPTNPKPRVSRKVWMELGTRPFRDEADGAADRLHGISKRSAVRARLAPSNSGSGPDCGSLGFRVACDEHAGTRGGGRSGVARPSRPPLRSVLRRAKENARGAALRAHSLSMLYGRTVQIRLFGALSRSAGSPRRLPASPDCYRVAGRGRRATVGWRCGAAR